MPIKIDLPDTDTFRKLMLDADVNTIVPVEDVLAALGEPTGYDDTQLRYGNRQSLLIDVEDGMAVGWHSFETGETSSDVGRLLEEKERYVSNVVPFDGSLEKRGKSRKWTNQEAVEHFWSEGEAIRLDGTSVAAYLRSRGINPDLPPELVRQVNHRSSEDARKFAAVSIPLKNHQGDVVGIQAIRCPGGAKLEHAAKITHGALKGAAFKLPGVKPMVLCEGPEDALSIWQETGREVWASCGKGNMANVQVPGDEVVLWLDNDMTQEEIGDLVDKLNVDNISAVMSDDHKDANAMLVGGGDLKAALKEAIQIKAKKREAWEDVDLNELTQVDLPRIEWLIPDYIKAASSCSMAGGSNIGKTNWTAMFVLACVSGKGFLIGKPDFEPFPVAWVSNEETTLDLKAKLQAAMIYHGIEAKERVRIRGNEHDQMVFVSKEDYSVEINTKAIKEVTKHCEGIKLAIFDPFNTLQMGVDTNAGAAEINKALADIRRATGCSTFFIHHTPKERGKAEDWYVGSDAGAWMGATQIYSGLDTGIIFARYTPTNKQDKDAWATVDKGERRRWVYASHGKARGFIGFDDQLYRIATVEISNGQTHPVMVPQPWEAIREVILDGEANLVEHIREVMDKHIDDEIKLAELHILVKDHISDWPSSATIQGRDHPKIAALLEGTGFYLDAPQKASKGHPAKVKRA